ncbi:hypothetical protein ACRTAL_002261 [Clostridium perfringens]
MVNKKDDIYISNEGVEWRVLEYLNSKNITVTNKFGEIKKIEKKQLKNIKSIYFKNINGIGFKGCIDCNVNSLSYSKWMDMIKRCYGKKTKTKNITYLNVSVCNEWHNYSNFRDWFDKHYVKGWDLDKDLLGGKIYSPKTCCFLPHDINTFLANKQYNNTTGYPGLSFLRGKFQVTLKKYGKPVYVGIYGSKKEAYSAYCIEREKYAKELATKWKDKLDKDIYLKIYNYKEML